jgi:hypothetical protein
VSLQPKATAGIILATQIRVPLTGYVTGLDSLHLPD